MVEVVAKTQTNFVKKLKTEEENFIDSHIPTCILENTPILPHELYIELSLHLHVYYYYPMNLAKELWEKQYSNIKRSENFIHPSVVKQQVKKAYLPVINSIRKKELRKYKHIINQEKYEQVIKEALFERDKRTRGYIDMLARDLRLKIVKVKNPKSNRTWRDQQETRNIKNQDEFEHELISIGSEFTQYKDRKRLRRRKGYGQYCARCRQEIRLIINSAPTGVKHKSIRIYKEVLSKDKVKNHLVCSKKCYDALRISTTRNKEVKRDLRLASFSRLQPLKKSSFF